jgi:hypothetical protein
MVGGCWEGVPVCSGGAIIIWEVVVVYICAGRWWETALCEKWSRCSEGAHGREV